VRRTASDCDEIISSAAEAARMAEQQPQCIDGAIEALERFARIDSAAINELAAAYYARARLQDQPVDLLRALDAADHAVAAMPRSPAAQFNHKRVLEALHVAPRSTAAAQWAHTQSQLTQALRSRDANTVRRLIAPFPQQAEALLEKGLVPAGRKDDAHFLATILAPITGDRLVLDVVDAMGKPHSPLELLAQFRQASTLEKLDQVERETIARGYRHVLAPIALQRGVLLNYYSRYLEALPQYEKAIAEYSRIGARDGVAGVHLRRIGTLRDLGQYDAAWREAMLTMSDFSAIVNPQDQHALLGETAATAVALGFPKAALLYQNAAVILYKNELRNTPPERLDMIAVVLRNIAIALRARAGIELQLDQYDVASADLNEAERLSAEEKEADRRPLLQARVDEVRGQALLRTAPSQAAAAFTSALTRTPKEASTYRASLLAQRGEALRRSGMNAEAEADLRASIDVLHAEETRARAQRADEDSWDAYFFRFQDTYRRLIRQLIDEGKAATAFVYAEQARSVELQGDVDIATLQRSLLPGSILLEYALLDDRTITWIVSRDRFEVVTQSVRRSDVERIAADLSRAVRSQNATEVEAQLYLLHRKLIAEPLRAIGATPRRLVVIPDGPMHSIPIAALHNGTTQRYLTEDTIVETAGSAKLYLLSLAHDQAIRGDTQQALLIGDPEFDEELPFAQGFKRLPGAKHEVESIRDVYEQAEMRIGSDATVPEFLALVRKSAVVELAAHALVNRQHSLLLLAPSAHDSGALDAHELIANLPHLDRTRLVVLSACSSAGGLPVGPEGIAPFVRPFVMSGVPAVVGTLWNIHDATVEELLVSFHRHYRQGSDAAEALRAAQVELLRKKNPGLRSVLAWAPFQVIGHASSPFASAPHNEKEKPP